MKLPSIAISLLLAAGASAATTIHTPEAYAYGANIGWIGMQGDVTSGVVIGEFLCSGYAYAANVGWIHFGGGAAANGYSYANNSATDYGVNVESYTSTGSAFQAKLRGYAYGANIGWINFEATGDPRVDLATGRLQGYAYGANVGWIALSETSVTVTTTSINPGPDTDGDSIPDAWEKFRVGNLTLGASATADADGDGETDREEYAADTNPLNGADKLEITTFVEPRQIGGVGPFLSDFTWTSRPTRHYSIDINSNLTSAWTPLLNNIIPGAATTTTRNSVTDTNGVRRFYQVRPKLPLVTP